MADPVPPEIANLADPVIGPLIVVSCAFAAVVTIVAIRSRPDARAWLGASATVSGGMALMNVVAASLGLWVGPAFEGRAFVVLVLATALGGLPGTAAWIGGYRLLRRWTSRPLLAYAAVALPFFPLVFVIDAWQMQRNEFAMAGGYQVWHDAVLGQAVMWAPPLLYEALSRWNRG
jgi:hypothetical protein